MRGFIFDLDGTVYLGDIMIEGAAEAIQALRDRGDKVVFLSNKPIATRQSYVEKLTKMGIPATLDEVLNSSQIVAMYLSEHLRKGESVYVIGEEPIVEELEDHGIPMTNRSDQADVVVLSWDRKFTYDKLNDAYQAAMRGAVIIASNPDSTCPSDEGQLPDTGTFIAALENALGRPIDLIAGKPSRMAAEAAINLLKLPKEQCYIVGDRLETDIKMGFDYGMNTVLVLTGISTKEMAERVPYRPKYIVPSIRDVVDLKA